MASAAMLMQNVAMEDNSFFLVDESDNTKVLKFQLSGITSGNTRTVTIPDSDVTIGSGSVAADDITAGDANVSLTTTSGNVTIKASTSNSVILGVDANSDVTITTGVVTFDGTGGFQLYHAGANASANLTITEAGNSSLIINSSSATTEDAVIISATAGGIDMDAAASKDINISGGQVALVSKDNAASAISLTANQGSSETIVITNTQGTSLSAVNLTATAGGIRLNGEKGIYLNAGTPALDDIGTVMAGVSTFRINLDTSTADAKTYSFGEIYANKTFYVEANIFHNDGSNAGFTRIRSLISRDGADNTAVVGTNAIETKGNLGGTVVITADDVNDRVNLVITNGDTTARSYRGTVSILTDDANLPVVKAVPS